MCGLLYILPWLAGVLVFQLYPFAYSLILSFTDKSMAEGMNFVGLQNYITIFTKDKDFWTNAEVTAKYVLMAVPGRVMFALLVALLLNVEIKGINFFRTVYYLPSIFGSSVAISIVWRFMFQKQGMVNELLGLIGVPGELVWRSGQSADHNMHHSDLAVWVLYGFVFGGSEKCAEIFI